MEEEKNPQEDQPENQENSQDAPAQKDEKGEPVSSEYLVPDSGEDQDSIQPDKDISSPMSGGAQGDVSSDEESVIIEPDTVEEAKEEAPAEAVSEAPVEPAPAAEEPVVEPDTVEEAVEDVPAEAASEEPVEPAPAAEEPVIEPDTVEEAEEAVPAEAASEEPVEPAPAAAEVQDVSREDVGPKVILEELDKESLAVNPEAPAERSEIDDATAPREETITELDQAPMEEAALETVEEGIDPSAPACSVEIDDSSTDSSEAQELVTDAMKQLDDLMEKIKAKKDSASQE